MLKKTLPLLIAVLVALLLVGCNGGSGTINPIELVPHKANMMGRIDLSQVLEDDDIIGLYAAVSKETELPQTLDEILDRFEEESGFDLRGLEGGVLFGDFSDSLGDDLYFGAIAEITFEKGDLIAIIEEAADIELNVVDYKGYEIYTDQDREGGIAFLSDEVVVIGTMEVLEDVIEVKEGDQSAISGKVLDMYNDLDDALVKVALTVPPGLAVEGLPEELGELPLGIDLSAFSDLETAGLALAKHKQSIALEMQLCFSNSDSAEEAERFIDALTVLIDMIDLPQGDAEQALLSLVENLGVSRSGACVDISIEMTISEIEELIESSG